MSKAKNSLICNKDGVEKRLKIFRERLQDLLNESSLSKGDFAGAASVSLPRVYAMLRGPSAPSLTNALKAADFFRCPLDYLFGFREDFSERRYFIAASVTDRVREGIDESRLSRYEISRRTGIDQSDLHRWYHGQKIPELVSLLRLAEVLDVSLDFLAGRDLS